MAPQARIAHTCVVDEDSSQILIFGGRSASEMKLQDLYAWDVEKEQLSLLAGSGPEDVSRKSSLPPSLPKLVICGLTISSLPPSLPPSLPSSGRPPRA